MMKIRNKKLAFGLLSLLMITLVFGACEHDEELLARLEYIKSIGNKEPELAMSMLDSIDWDVKSMSTYALNKKKLLRIRLKDKADVMPTTNKHIVELVEYFDKEGKGRDRQEAYYYAGSVYRDLQDAPRALENFRTSAEICLSIDDCDSLLLRNTYSNLYFVYHSVQDYQNALKAAKQEYEVARRIGVIDAMDANHVGISLYKTGHEDESKRYFKESLTLARKDAGRNIGSIDILMFYFSRLEMETEADECYAMVKKYGDLYVSAEKGTSMAAYFWMKNELDSAAYYYKESLATDDLMAQSDASKCLYDLYQRMGDEGEELKYARKHIEVTSKLDLGLRQEMAATENNQHQYFIDKQKEAQLAADNERNWLFLIIVALSATLIIACLVAWTQYRKSQIRKELEDKTRELKAKEDNLKDVNEKSRHLDSRLAKAEEELKDKKLQLERMNEMLKNKNTLIMQFCESNIAPDLKHMMDRIKEVEYSPEDKLTDDDWKELVALVNIRFPDFHTNLTAKRRHQKQKRVRACYLMCLPLSNAQISRLVGDSRANVGRWRKSAGTLIKQIMDF